ncbi:uncharacterized protein EDB91DRAFT_1081265 [Suillus paluster]|uniref:uncharacterized protein n=1 Tax=Suillus paluster TaxID=48578 RepID=UPI001B86B8A5|nr:uncharacterized protein EDB91DRAFT_1081265 [Suillus paluster]KAG1742608.1 hypothetical protein EDB91DRAFT_1081265 [Suillus paluster]
MLIFDGVVWGFAAVFIVQPTWLAKIPFTRFTWPCSPSGRQTNGDPPYETCSVTHLSERQWRTRHLGAHLTPLDSTDLLAAALQRLESFGQVLERSPVTLVFDPCGAVVIAAYCQIHYRCVWRRTSQPLDPAQSTDIAYSTTYRVSYIIGSSCSATGDDKHKPPTNLSLAVQ